MVPLLSALFREDVRVLSVDSAFWSAFFDVELPDFFDELELESEALESSSLELCVPLLDEDALAVPEEDR